MRYEIITSATHQMWHDYGSKAHWTWQRNAHIYWTPRDDLDQRDVAWREWRRGAPAEEGMDFAHTAVRFSHKTQAIVQHCAHSTADVVIWMDLDVKQHAPCDELSWLMLLPTATECVTWLDRSPVKHAETGWLALNLTHPGTHEILREVEQCYVTGAIWQLPEWHDAYIFTHVIKSGGHPARNLLHNPRSSEPFDHSELAPWFRHYKGLRKRHI